MQKEKIRPLNIMNPKQLLRTIYLGDRACKAILIESWKRRVAIQVDVISRLRPGTETWDYYTGGDVVDGWLVFCDVRNICFEPSGPVPNDYINNIAVQEIEVSGDKPMYLFGLSVGSVDAIGGSKEVLIKIEAGSMVIEDPRNPSAEIA